MQQRISKAPECHKRRHGLGAAAVIAATVVFSAGCYATTGYEAEVYGYPAQYVEAVPVEVTTYPTVIYRGRPAYLVGSRWYYLGPKGWVVFQEEPVELRQYRTAPAPPRVPPQQPRYEQPPRYEAVPRVQPPPRGVEPPVEERRRYYPR